MCTRVPVPCWCVAVIRAGSLSSFATIAAIGGSPHPEEDEPLVLLGLCYAYPQQRANAINQIAIHQTRIQGNQGWGINFQVQARGLDIQGSDLEGNGVGQVRLAGALGLHLAANYFERLPTMIVLNREHRDLRDRNRGQPHPRWRGWGHPSNHYSGGHFQQRVWSFRATGSHLSRTRLSYAMHAGGEQFHQHLRPSSSDDCPSDARRHRQSPTTPADRKGPYQHPAVGRLDTARPPH
jgi:hypothetical protein